MILDALSSRSVDGFLIFTLCPPMLDRELTTVAMPTTIIGEQAFLLLLAVLEKGHVPAQVTIPLELVIRASTTRTKDNHEGLDNTCVTTS